MKEKGKDRQEQRETIVKVNASYSESVELNDFVVRLRTKTTFCIANVLRICKVYVPAI